MDYPFDGAVPERVRQRAEQFGAHTRQWLDYLPQRINDIERDWGVRVGPALSGGSAAFVASARTSDGTSAVVKLAMPGCDFKLEIDTLLRAQGNGYAHVLRYDFARDAVLLEALGPPMGHLPLSPEQTIVLLCKTLKQAWRIPPSPGQPIEYKAQMLSRMIPDLWERLGRPCPKAVIDRALLYADRRSRAFDPARCLVVHGDLHPANALEVIAARAGAESGFVLVDPDGFLCEPEYDLGVVLRDWCQPILAAPDPARLARSYCKLLAHESQLPERAIWEWGFIERVSTGLYISAYGAKSLGLPFFETAALLL